MNSDGKEKEHSSRLREIRNSIGVSVASFARGLNVPRSTLVGWEDGKAVSIDILPALRDLYGVNLDWFLTGAGEMFINGTAASSSEKLHGAIFGNQGQGLAEENDTVSDLVNKGDVPSETDTMSVSVAEENYYPAQYQRSVLEGITIYRFERGRAVPVIVDPSEASEEDFTPVPLFNQRISAGPGQEETQLEETKKNIPALLALFGMHKPKRCGFAQVSGDSMADIGIFHADWCLFDLDDKKGDGIFTISMFGEMRVKRLQYRLSDRKIIIASENRKRYPEPEIVSVELVESGELKIHGRVFAWFHKHPY